MSLTEVAEYAVTMSCLGCSMVCLLLTVTAYTVFPVLRTRAGKNNVVLSLSLMLAQASLIVSSHTTAPGILCTTIGITTHFLWLWMFSWTLVCSHHMFKVFTARTPVLPGTPREQNVELMKTVGLSLAVPTVVCVAVVATHLVVYDGTKTGYGETSCYMDNTFLVGLSLVGPLAVIITCNLSFFLTTVCIIHKTRRMQSAMYSSSDLVKDVFIYAKLSTITGAFWTLAVVAEALDVTALRFISIVINGLQGVFIFLSYTCNKRVLDLIVMFVYGHRVPNTMSAEATAPYSMLELTHIRPL
ncbi:adhesion G protein-coupled receptor E3-like [Physella acuta]|uniref:adhesion G protein-coupled receptor E3-like n=1 Tax=Physella acuta TaxID=109671 RepID=UPI0027DE7499|nr:adhesion G protein-coupled receptor E3-like [Physella acuta]